MQARFAYVFDMIHENGMRKLVSLLDWFTVSQGILLHQSGVKRYTFQGENAACDLMHD